MYKKTATDWSSFFEVCKLSIHDFLLICRKTHIGALLLSFSTLRIIEILSRFVPMQGGGKDTEMIIDFHTHMFPDALAAKTIPYLAQKSGYINMTDGTLDGTIESMDQNGIDKSVVCNIATNAHQTEKVNAFAIEIDKNDRIISFGSVHPDCDYEYYLDILKDNGIKGIKLHPDYQDFFIDDAKMSKIYEAILKRGFVLIFHTGVDDGFGEPVHASPERIKRVMPMFRGEKVVLAHMGGFKLWDKVCKFLAGEDVYLDTSCSAGFMTREMFEKMVLAHGVDKILFATDTPWTKPADGIEEINALNISDAEKKNIFSGNAQKLLGL